MGKNVWMEHFDLSASLDTVWTDCSMQTLCQQRNTLSYADAALLGTVLISLICICVNKSARFRRMALYINVHTHKIAERADNTICLSLLWFISLHSLLNCLLLPSRLNLQSKAIVCFFEFCFLSFIVVNQLNQLNIAQLASFHSSGQLLYGFDYFIFVFFFSFSLFLFFFSVDVFFNALIVQSVVLTQYCSVSDCKRIFWQNWKKNAFVYIA